LRIQQWILKNRGYVYILTNHCNTVVYTSVTSNLIQRIYQHRQKTIDGFSKRYNLDKIVYYKIFDLVADAIYREKRIKKLNRQQKLSLVTSMNPPPEWNHLYENFFKIILTSFLYKMRRSPSLPEGGG
jgi:putative endonuclease